MQTIQLEIQDDIYEELKSKEIDINNKLQDLLYDLVDDGYPSISTEEAKQRVSDAVDRYRNGTGSYTSTKDYEIKMAKFMDGLSIKYDNH